MVVKAMIVKIYVTLVMKIRLLLFKSLRKNILRVDEASWTNRKLSRLFNFFGTEKFIDTSFLYLKLISSNLLKS